jgi:hypothetical protein
MAIPSSGPLSMTTIQTEFGGSNPIGLNEYYAGGGLVPAGTSGTYGAVPSSGPLGIQNFYGTSNVSGWYYFIAPTSGTEVQLNGIQPLSTGSLIGSLRRLGNSQFVYVLNTTGAVSFCTSPSGGSGEYPIFLGTMNDGNGHAFANDTVPMFYKIETRGIARLSSNGSLIQSVVHGVNLNSDAFLGGVSASTSQAYCVRSQLIDPETGANDQHWVMLDFVNNTVVSKYWRQQSQDNFWTAFREGLSLTDATWCFQVNGWTGNPAGGAIMQFNKTTGALNGSNGYHLSGMNTPWGFVSDPSGNMYMSSNAGKICKMNSTITSISWSKQYSESGVTSSDTYIAYYDGFLYAVQDQRNSTGTLLMRINPSNGDVVWSVRINNSFIQRVTGITVTANGIIVLGRTQDAPRNGAIFNYPIAGGVFGSFNAGQLVLTSVTASASNVTVNITNPSYPSFSTSTARGTVEGYALNANTFPYSRSTY